MKKKKVFLGIDLATTNSWIVVLDSSQQFVEKKFIGYKSHYLRKKSGKGDFKDCLRLQFLQLVEYLIQLKKSYKLELFIEVPQFNYRNFAASFKLHVLFGMVVQAAEKAGVFWIGINTNVYKLFINQKCYFISKLRKAEAIKWANFHYPELEIEDHNIADALSIAYFASKFKASKLIKDKFILNSKRDIQERD